MKTFIRRLFIVLFFLVIAPWGAQAACINPAGDHGDMLYNRDHTVMQYCNGTDWTSMDASKSGGKDNLGNHTATQDLNLADFKATNAAIPTSSKDLTNKAYVDAAVASAAGSGGGGATFTIWGSANCPVKSVELYRGDARFAAGSAGGMGASSLVCVQGASALNNNGGSHQSYWLGGTGYNASASQNLSCAVCMTVAQQEEGPAPAPNTTSGYGYLVLTSVAYNGNLGGISGANDKCKADLQANNWKYKSDVNNFDNVRALLCDSSACNGLKQYQIYRYAQSGNATNGGYEIPTASASTLIGLGGTTTTYWTGVYYYVGSSMWNTNFFGSTDQKWWTNIQFKIDTNAYIHVNDMDLNPTPYKLLPTENCNQWKSNSGSYTASFGWNSSGNGTNYSMPLYAASAACSGSYKLLCIVD